MDNDNLCNIDLGLKRISTLQFYLAIFLEKLHINVPILFNLILFVILYCSPVVLF